MLRRLSLAAGAIAFILLIFGLYGGLGALMAFGYVGESLVRDFPRLEFIWSPLIILWSAIWLLGVFTLIFKWPIFWKMICGKARILNGRTEVSVGLGHLVVCIALLGSVLVPEHEFFYFGLVVAAAFYAAGITLIGRNAILT